MCLLRNLSNTHLVNIVRCHAFQLVDVHHGAQYGGEAGGKRRPDEEELNAGDPASREVREQRHRLGVERVVEQGVGFVVDDVTQRS